LAGYRFPASGTQASLDTEAALEVARSWAGLTTRSQILVSVEQLAAGQRAGLLLAHESVHDILIQSSVFGMQQIVLGSFGMPPEPEFSLTGMLRRMLASTTRASVRTHEGCATFIPSLGLDGAELAAYLASLPPGYRDLAQALEWLRTRGLNDEAGRELVFAIGRFSLGVRLPSEAVCDAAALAGFLGDPAHRPDTRFATALTALKLAGDAELRRLSQASVPEAQIAERCYPATYEYVPPPSEQRLAWWDELVTEMASAWIGHPRVTESERNQLRDGAQQHVLLYQPPLPSVLKAVLTHTFSASGRVADHPAASALLPYELATISYNGGSAAVPGIESVDGESWPLAKGEAALWLTGSDQRNAAVRLSDSELREYLAAADPDTTFCLYDGYYVFAVGDVMADEPLFRDRPHVVLVTQRTLGALLTSSALSRGLAGSTKFRYATVDGDTPGVSYFLIAPKRKPYPVLVAPAPVATTERAAREVERGHVRGNWTRLSFDETAKSGVFLHLARVFSWFENRPWAPGLERRPPAGERHPQIGRPDRPDYFQLGPPPDSHGRNPDTRRNLRPPVRRQLDKAERFEERGDLARAQAEYTSMTASTDRQAKAAGAIAMGLMLVRHGDPAGAAAAYSMAAGTGDPDLAPLALLYSGQATQLAGDLPAALKLFQAAARTRHPDHAPPAAYCLGQIGQAIGLDAIRLSELFTWAVDSGHPGVWPLAAVQLATVLHENGSPDLAMKVLRRALGSRHQEARTQAARLIDTISQPP
jgi:hypothetical protein